MAIDYIGDCYMSSYPLSRKQVKALIFSIFVAMLGYLALSLSFEWQEVWSAYQTIGFLGIALTLLLSLVNYVLRFMRWQIYLSTMKYCVPFRRSIVVYFAGFSLTTTPGKAGEMLRGVFLKSYGVPFTSTAAAFISERLSDLFAIVLLCLLGIAAYSEGGSILLVGCGVIICAQVVLSSVWLISLLQNRAKQSASKLGKAVDCFTSIILDARRCNVFWLQAISLVISLLAWSAEAYAFYLIVSWTGSDISITIAFSIYAVSMLAGALSFLPGGVGSAEAVMIALLLWAGIGESQAIAATVVIRLVTLWFAVIIGCLSLLQLGKVDVPRKVDVRP
ncbi:lysylphosphatidylglycerol synthase transmembrane domain-containing protein [Marinomonas fungiae]|nr:lysylphosphatidylglycerol synthase transmembrane domain-containing protein [Marinomonas fungiae]